MKNEIELRLRWVELYEQTHNAELVCLRCGISRPTLEKWLGRYRKFGKEGLKSLSHKPTVPGRVPAHFRQHSLKPDRAAKLLLNSNHDGLLPDQLAAHKFGL